MLALSACNATAREPCRQREHVIISHDRLITIIIRPAGTLRLAGTVSTQETGITG
jgi:hypothetical protein